jgi:hypothetical protein
VNKQNADDRSQNDRYGVPAQRRKGTESVDSAVRVTGEGGRR